MFSSLLNRRRDPLRHSLQLTDRRNPQPQPRMRWHS
jgi:hypothetical protein